MKSFHNSCVCVDDLLSGCEQCGGNVGRHRYFDDSYDMAHWPSLLYMWKYIIDQNKLWWTHWKNPSGQEKVYLTGKTCLDTELLYIAIEKGVKQILKNHSCGSQLCRAAKQLLALGTT